MCWFGTHFIFIYPFFFSPSLYTQTGKLGDEGTNGKEVATRERGCGHKFYAPRAALETCVPRVCGRDGKRKGKPQEKGERENLESWKTNEAG